MYVHAECWYKADAGSVGASAAAAGTLFGCRKARSTPSAIPSHPDLPHPRLTQELAPRAHVPHASATLQSLGVSFAAGNFALPARHRDRSVLPRIASAASMQAVAGMNGRAAGARKRQPGKRPPAALQFGLATGVLVD
eukprot:206326-Chlamydomonas_euryale.AAC.5